MMILQCKHRFTNDQVKKCSATSKFGKPKVLSSQKKLLLYSTSFFGQREKKNEAKKREMPVANKLTLTKLSVTTDNRS